jgi:hypothetical protein
VNVHPNIDWRDLNPVSASALLLWLGLAALVGGFFLLVAALGYGVAGFPLDDAWIHQTYARNLATAGQWAFVPGQTSAGSTSPLWSLLLGLGYWLGVPYWAWAYGLGIVALGLTAWTVTRLGLRFFPAKPWAGPLAGLLCVLEWHLVWASVSGMETMLYTWLSVLLIDLWLVADDRSQSGNDGGWWDGIALWWGLGVVGGLLALTRPEGLGLVGLIGLVVGWRLRRSLRRLLRAWLAIGVGLALPLVPYLVFHYTTTGLPFPNTFYAKQEEYRALLSMYSVWRRWLMVAAVTLVGGQVLLLPGFVYAVWRSASNARTAPSSGAARAPGPKCLQPPDSEPWPSIYGPLLCAAWWFVHLALYALRLPVTYQHGRYQIPIIPFFVLVGAGGTAYLLRPGAWALVVRVLSQALMAATLVLVLVFLVLGARAYAADVAFIQGEMVAIARWLESNVPTGALIAVHDIGAIGYFTPRPLLDLAGLVTPEVIPFISNEARLIEFMQAQGADYVVFFPDWSDAYRRMALDPRLEPIYVTGFEWTLDQGRANMTVYRLQPLGQ